jgi:hypothetical protein
VSNRTVIVLAAACLGIPLATQPAVADSIPLNTLNLVGTSQILPSGTLRLTPNFDPNPSGPIPAGAAWTTSTLDVKDAFSVDFHFQMSDPCLAALPTCVNDHGNGGDGIAFLIQDSAQGDAAIGVGAGGMGFLGISDSVAVMLDTYQNNSPNFYGDPSNNYISVNTRGTDFNVPHHFCTNVNGKFILTADASVGSDLTGSVFSDACTANPTLGMTGFGGVNPLAVNMDDGKVHDIGISYVPGTLDISLDSVLVLAVSINLANTLSLQGGNDAFLGFTAGTRFAYQNQDILDFTITPEPAAGQLWIPLAMIAAAALTRKWQRNRS